LFWQGFQDRQALYSLFWQGFQDRQVILLMAEVQELKIALTAGRSSRTGNSTWSAHFCLLCQLRLEPEDPHIRGSSRAVSECMEASFSQVINHPDLLHQYQGYKHII
jgi:hypothetical protein